MPAPFFSLALARDLKSVSFSLNRRCAILHYTALDQQFPNNFVQGKYYPVCKLRGREEKRASRNRGRREDGERKSLASPSAPLSLPALSGACSVGAQEAATEGGTRKKNASEGRKTDVAANRNAAAGRGSQ